MRGINRQSDPGLYAGRLRSKPAPGDRPGDRLCHLPRRVVDQHRGQRRRPGGGRGQSRFGLHCGNNHIVGFSDPEPGPGDAAGLSNVFITKLDANGQLVYSTYLGGSGFDGGAAIKVDDTGAAYVGGSTCSADFPTVNPLQATYGLNCDAFCAKLSPDGAQLVYST